jgi:adenylylsulfate kinase
MAGRTYWITGLSGAGKTTLAERLQGELIRSGEEVLLLDGDRVRGLFGDDLGHDSEARRRSAWRNARLCRALASEGFQVICATISMFHEVRAWARANVPGYTEIYLRVPEEERRRRDPKGLYRTPTDMAGLDQECELPDRPDFCFDNHGATTIDRVVAELVAGTRAA